MDLSFLLSGSEKAATQYQVDSFNSALNNGRVVNNQLGKDDFLKILVTQLSHQDPTDPMKDRDFIAQMAEFSALEQITNMNQQFSALAGMLASSQAVSLLGRSVEILSGEALVTGVVEEIAGKDFPQVIVGGTYYDFSKITRVW